MPHATKKRHWSETRLYFNLSLTYPLLLSDTKNSTSRRAHARDRQQELSCTAAHTNSRQ